MPESSLSAVEALPSRPVLVVGSGRSGTTILYKILSGHRDLAWISNLADKAPALPVLSAATRARRLAPPRLPPLTRLIPSEGYRVWNACRPVDPRNDPPLTEVDATAEEVVRTRRLIARHVRYQGNRRFLNKNTRNTRRIRYLNRVFPDAIFVHVLRDPRAAVASMSRVAFWENMPLWCRNGETVRDLTARGEDPVALAAELWTAEVACALEHQAVLPPARYLEVRYEDLMAEPIRVLQDLCARTDLPWSREFEASIAQFALKSQNFKFSSAFTETQLATIATITAGLGRRLGYAPDA
jgi:omega-hydroxy-beta-dihydromenaquinone-9 sulfotransferase